MTAKGDGDVAELTLERAPAETNEESLRWTRKVQNIRQGRTLLERVHAIQNAGIDVWCGMIVGFDHDDPSVFAAHRDLVRSARINHAMISMLSANPKTPLYQRLSDNGRLAPEGSEFGTNVIPLRMSREELRDGFVQLMRDLYEPNAYFERFESLYLAGGFTLRPPAHPVLAETPLGAVQGPSGRVARCAVLSWRLIRTSPRRNSAASIGPTMAFAANVVRSVGAFRLFLEVRRALSSLSDGRADRAGEKRTAESVLRLSRAAGEKYSTAHRFSGRSARRGSFRQRAVKLGLDVYGPLADRLTVAARTTVGRGTIAVLEHIKETAGNLGCVDMHRNVPFWKEHSLAGGPSPVDARACGRNRKGLKSSRVQNRDRRTGCSKQ